MDISRSIVLNNIKLNNVPTAVGIVGGGVVLNGGTTTIDTWVQGNVYTGTSTAGRFTQGNVGAIPKASTLLDGSGRIFGKSHPQYAAYSPSQIISVKAAGAKGDVCSRHSRHCPCDLKFIRSGQYR
jgi:glucan 1,3-beta-glucosidase